MYKHLAVFSCVCVPLILNAMDTKTLSKVRTTKKRFTAFPSSYEDERVKNFIGSRTIISNKQLKKTANQSIEEALQNVPGVQIRNNTGTGVMPSISLRGFGGGGAGHSNAGLFLMNGVPITPAPYSKIQLSVFPITFQMIDRIDVIKGGASVQYGPNTFGGVFNFITKAIPTKWENQASERITFWGKSKNGGFYDPKSKNPLSNNMLYNTFLRTGGMINKHFGIQASANWIKGQGFRDNSPTNLQNYMLEGLYQINSNNVLKMYYQYYNSFAKNPGSLAIKDYQENRFANLRPNNALSGNSKRYGLEYKNTFGDSDKIYGEFSFSYFTHDMSRNYALESSFMSVNLNPNIAPIYSKDTNTILNNARRYVVNAFEPKLKLSINNTRYIKQDLVMGLRFMTEDTYDTHGFKTFKGMTKEMGSPTKLLNNYTAFYLSDEMKFFDEKLVIAPGFRYTFLNYHFVESKGSKKTHFNQINPAVNIAYRPIKGLNIYANYMRSYIPPQYNLNGWNTHYFQIFDEFEAGARYALNDLLSFNANYFAIYANNYYTGRYASRPVNALSQGVELELYLKPIRGLNIHASYTYIDARITNNRYHDGQDIKNKRLPFTSPNQFVLDASYTYKGTTFGLSSYFYSRSYSDILNHVQEKTIILHEHKKGEYAGLFENQTYGILPWYWVWNIQISQILWESGRQQITASLQVNNLFNMKYYFRGIGTSWGGREPAPGRSVTALVSYNF
ncbi:TonB-dependent receptor family protein [Helicobacter cetorum]|uniref:TonB-dependent receptor family protein n=1 Tax=Helicobacter cetorum TaxID=138563 RepID=UPI000CF03559|nr:TonB-dependent receptor [Helicobacter cetorum]